MHVARFAGAPEESTEVAACKVKTLIAKTVRAKTRSSTCGRCSDDELAKQMHDDLYDGLKEEIEEGTNILLERGWGGEARSRRCACRGDAHRRDRLPRRHPLRPRGAARRQRDEGGDGDPASPSWPRTGAATIGKVVIGTVKGDIHDIGKNLVGMMLEGAGFEVIDLGINTDADEFLAALEEHKPDILGMSALLTTTMPYMKVVIDTLKERGWRDDYTVLVGGAPSTSSSPRRSGADAYCRDAAVAVETAKEFMARQHNIRGARRPA